MPDLAMGDMLEAIDALVGIDLLGLDVLEDSQAVTSTASSKGDPFHPALGYVYFAF